MSSHVMLFLSVFPLQIFPGFYADHFEWVSSLDLTGRTSRTLDLAASAGDSTVIALLDLDEEMLELHDK